MRCRLLTFSLERPSRVWGINSPKASMYWLMEGICGHWPSKSWSRQRGARPKSSEPKAAKNGVELRMPPYVYILIKSQAFFDEKPLTFSHPNCGSQKTLRALQNSDLSPRLGDSRQSEPKSTGQLPLDPKSQSQDRTGRPFPPTAELFRRAIDDHRKLEKLIDQMRAISQQVLLNSVEGPARRKRTISS